MASTTYYSTARTFNYAVGTNKLKPMVAYKVVATRKTNTDSKVTLTLHISLGWDGSKKGTFLDDPFVFSIKVGGTTLDISKEITKSNGVAGTLYDRKNSEAYAVTTDTVSKEITWTDGKSLAISGTCKQAHIGDPQNFSGGSISMPAYSSGSGGSGGGSTTTVVANKVTISLSKTTVAPNEEVTLSITPTIGSGNSISKYVVYKNGVEEIEFKHGSNNTHTFYSSKEGTYNYKVYAYSGVTGKYVVSNVVTLTVKEVVPVLTSSKILPTIVSNTTGGGVRLYATSNTGYYSYYVNGVYKGYSDAASVYIYPVYSGNKISVKAYNPSNGSESAEKTYTVGGFNPVIINSITITPQIIKDNITYDLVKTVSGSASVSNATSIEWQFRQSDSPSKLENAVWQSLGIYSNSFSNINMAEKIDGKGRYYQFRIYAENANDYDSSDESEIYQIPALPTAPTITKVIPKADPSESYEIISKDGKIYYGSGLFLTWNMPTILDSQVPIKEIELIYKSKSSSDTDFGETKVAQIMYHKYLENNTLYTFKETFPYNALLPIGASNYGGGADLEVLSLHETRIGLRVTDELNESVEIFYPTTYYKAESPSFGGNLIVSQNSFRPFTCNTNETFTLSSSVGQSNSQDSLYYFIDCYVGDRKVTIPIINKIPIATSIFSDTSKESGYVIYSNDNFTITKYNGTTIYYTIKNSYLKSLLLSSEGLRSPKNNLSAIYNDDFFNVVYKISVRDDFDSRSTVYNSNTISINFIEAPTLSNNNYLDIGVNRYLKSLNPFSDNSIIMATTTSSNNNRIINPGESVIFKFKRAQDYNAADYISTMLGDVTQYNIYVSRNDEPVTSNYDKLAYTLLKSYLVEELKKALPSNSTDEYYYLEYPLQSYQESKFVTFRIEAVDSKGLKSDYLYSNTYLVPCRATTMDFYLRSIILEDDSNAGVTLKFKTKVNDFGASTFINDNYNYNNFPNYERNYTVNNNTFTRKGEIIFEGSLDGNFNNTGIAVLSETEYDNYFSSTIDLIPHLTDKKYPDILGFEDTLFQVSLPEEWQENGKLKSDIKKIFFRITYKIAYGFADLEATDYDKYLFVSSTSAPYSYYEDAPTVSYRNHQVGINTKDFNAASDTGQQEVLIIQDNGSYNLVVFKGAEQKITLNLTERTFRATTKDGKETIINFDLGIIDGMVVDGGQWA